MLVAVITTKVAKTSKGITGGADTILTVFDMGTSYTDMLSQAVAKVDSVDVSEFSEEAVAQAKEEQVNSWTSAIEGKEDGGVRWANDASRDGIRIIKHASKGTEYVMGQIVASKVLELDETRPAPVNKRGPRNEVTAVKNQLRKLASGWRMVALNDSSIIMTGEEAQALLATI